MTVAHVCFDWASFPSVFTFASHWILLRKGWQEVVSPLLPFVVPVKGIVITCVAISDGSDYFRPRLRPFRPFLRAIFVRPPFFLPLDCFTTPDACAIAELSEAPRLMALA